MADIFELFRRISGENKTAAGPISRMIVGLGNPGEEYRSTRHNAGYLTADALAERHGLHIDRMKFQALTAELMLGEERVLLLKPLTFMNLSGNAVKAAADFYKLAPDRILVISDDISLAPGKMRLRRRGSAGGHNGLKSIIEQLGSQDFPRLKMGVGAKPHPDYDLADWVLSSFSKAEQADLLSAAEAAERGILLWLEGKFEDAVQHCNSFAPQSRS